MSIILLNPNNLAVKLNFTAPIYAHFDRSTYEKQIFNPETLQNEAHTFHKCVLHIDTFLKDTNFEYVVFTLNNNGNLIRVKTEENVESIVLQDDENPRIDTQNISYNISATYQAEAYSRDVSIKPNRTITCSRKLKLHSGLKPFNYEQLVTNQQEVNNNE